MVIIVILSDQGKAACPTAFSSIRFAPKLTRERCLHRRTPCLYPQAGWLWQSSRGNALQERSIWKSEGAADRITECSHRFRADASGESRDERKRPAENDDET